jgi:hypothetical protein
MATESTRRKPSNGATPDNFMKLSYEQLKQAGACRKGLNSFSRRFGRTDAIEVTEELCLKCAPVFPWDWASHNLLPTVQLEHYRREAMEAYRVYRRACDHADGLTWHMDRGDLTRPEFLKASRKRKALIVKARKEFVTTLAKTFYLSSQVDPNTQYT